MYEILVVCENPYMLELEQKLIDLNWENPLFLNLSPTAINSTGYRHTEESRKKISDKAKGHIPWNKGKKGVYTQETLDKIGAASKGRIPNKETRSKMSEAHMGRPPTNKGISHTPETIAKMSIASTGRKHSEESKEKIRQASLKHRHTEESKQKMREKRYSPESKKKISDALKLSWKKKKEAELLLED